MLELLQSSMWILDGRKLMIHCQQTDHKRLVYAFVEVRGR